LYDLVSHPDYIAPLREEIESAVTEGWTVSSLEKMHKLDSFLKESIRHHSQGPGNIVILTRVN